MKRYYANHEDELAYKKEYRDKHQEEHRKYFLQWRAENPDKVRAQRLRERVRQTSADGTHTADELTQIRQLQDGKCLYCGMILDGKGTVDHFIPLKHDGRNSKVNLAWACKHCNSSKGARLPWNWRGWNGAYPVFWDGRLL